MKFRKSDCMTMSSRWAGGPGTRFANVLMMNHEEYVMMVLHKVGSVIGMNHDQVVLEVRHDDFGMCC